MDTKIWAHLDAAGASVVDIESLPSGLVPGEDIHRGADKLVDVTALASKPAKGWSYDGKAFAPPPPWMPTKAHLAATARSKRVSLLEAGGTFNVAAPPQAAIVVSCDGIDTTTTDLGGLWRRGVVSATALEAWIDNDNVSTILTGAQFVTLDGLVSAWRSALEIFLAAMIKRIDDGDLTTLAGVEAAAWPVPTAGT